MNEPISMDQAFINKLTEIVLANMSGEHFGVEKLAKAAGISHVSLHRRLKSTRNQDASQFIREIRLQRAMELLRQNAGTASEIAFMVGFGSPAYFSKCFHDHYGFPPGEVKRKSFTIIEQDIKATNERQAYPEHEQSIRGEIQVLRKKSRRRILLLVVSALIILLPLSWYLYDVLNLESGTISHRKEYNRSILILPFKDLSGNAENHFFADGIMEDILNSLCRISALNVRSRTTSELYRENDLSPREIAHKENARYILEGSVRRYDKRARITVQLIDAFRDKHIWSENFDRDMTDIIGIQGSIATKVALQLKVSIPGIDIKNIEKVYTKNPQAYDNFLKAKFLLNKANEEQRMDISKEGLTLSIQYYEKAIAADTNFAEAYAGLAGATLALSGWGWQQPRKEGFMKAEVLCTKALDLNPDCAEAHAVKGNIYIWGYRNFEEGRKELITTLKLNPNYPPVHQAYAQLLMVTGPIEEARLYIDLAIKFEPRYWVLHNLNAWIYYFEGRYDEAIDACIVARDLKSDYILTNWLLFLNYSKLGEGEKAAGELQTIVKLYDGDKRYIEEINAAYRESGIEGLFKWLVDINIKRPLPDAGLSGHPFYIAWWYAILGDKEQSIFWLQKNMEAKLKLYPYFNLIATNPDFDILRNDPRFLTIIDQLGLKPYHNRRAK